MVVGESLEKNDVGAMADEPTSQFFVNRPSTSPRLIAEMAPVVESVRPDHFLRVGCRAAVPPRQL